MSIEKIFKAYDVRATTPEPLNEDAAWRVGHAAAQFLKRSRATTEVKVGREDTIVVGGDMRPHTPSLKAALIDGIRSVGTHVIDVGMIDTSFIYFAINHLDCVGGIQVTASHNPIHYNGFKISGPKAVPIGSASGLDDIKRIAVQTRVGKTGLEGKLEEMDLWVPYREHVHQFLDLPNPIKIAVDASNGMAGVMVPKVFEGVPNLEIEKILFEVTGSFTHEPNPLVEENLKWVQDEVKKGGYAAGGCFDGDADRCIFVDEKGDTVGCDILTALLTPDFLAGNDGATVVYDLRSSHIVPDTITAHGGVPKRDRVGHAFIKKTMKETAGVFAGELSGHFYFKDNFYADSGAMAFAALVSHLSKAGKPLSELVAPLKKYAQSGEINYEVEDKDGKIRELADVYRKAKSIDYLDGITIEMDDWWFNVRKSNTEPLLRLNLEANTQAEVDQRVAELQKLLGEPAEGH
ncbi:MAG: phosphomannomutase/phosphoglucomutase [Planctomycetota bacterium]